MFSHVRWKKISAPGNEGGGGEAGARPVFPFSTALNELNIGYACQSIC